MGMYNEVIFTCPECDNFIMEQTKSGTCSLATRNSDRVPLEEVSGLGSSITCESCGT